MRHFRNGEREFSRDPLKINLSLILKRGCSYWVTFEMFGKGNLILRL